MSNPLNPANPSNPLNPLNPPSPPNIQQWSDAQLRVMHAFDTGQHVILTGAAGTGKTTILRYLQDIVHSCHGPSSIHRHVFGPWELCDASLPPPTLQASQQLSCVVANQEQASTWQKMLGQDKTVVVEFTERGF